MVTAIFISALFLFLTTFAYAGFRGAPWVPTRSSDVERLLKLADIKPGQKFYDLGCGDGRTIIAAARQGAVTEGFEISLLPYLIAKMSSVFCKDGKVTVKYKDFWNYDLSDADIIYFFLMPKIYPKLRLKLERELRSGTKVVSYAWPIDGWQPVAVGRTENRLPLFLYLTF